MLIAMFPTTEAETRIETVIDNNDVTDLAIDLAIDLVNEVVVGREIDELKSVITVMMIALEVEMEIEIETESTEEVGMIGVGLSEAEDGKSEVARTEAVTVVAITVLVIWMMIWMTTTSSVVLSTKIRTVINKNAAIAVIDQASVKMAAAKMSQMINLRLLQ